MSIWSRSIRTARPISGSGWAIWCGGGPSLASSPAACATAGSAPASMNCCRMRFPGRRSPASLSRSSITSRTSPPPSTCRLSKMPWRSRSTASAIFPVRPGASAAAAHIAVEGRVFFPHSLGIFYQALTQYLGFRNYGDEYKVMGLAPYGAPQFLDTLSALIDLRDDGTFRLEPSYFVHHHQSISHQWDNGSPDLRHAVHRQAGGAARSPPAGRRSARPAPHGHRPLGAGAL